MIILAIYLFYIGFAVAISVYRQWLKGTLNLWNKVLFAPVLISFFFLDVFVNYTVLLVLGWPPQGCHTISERLAEYHTTSNASDFQKAVATFVCEKLLNPIDPTGAHC